jgi:hypothetical protein
VLRPQGALPALLPALRLAGSGVPWASARAAPPEVLPFAARADLGFQRLSMTSSRRPPRRLRRRSCRLQVLFSPLPLALSRHWNAE